MKFDLSGMDLSIQKVLKWTLPFYKNDQDGKRKGWETRRNTGASLISHQEMRKREPTDCKKKKESLKALAAGTAISLFIHLLDFKCQVIQLSHSIINSKCLLQECNSTNTLYHIAWYSLKGRSSKNRFFPLCSVFFCKTFIISDIC